MTGAAPAARPRAATRNVDAEFEQRLQDPSARRAAADELRAIASSLERSLRRDRTAPPGQVAALQRAINLYTGSAKLEVDDKFGRHTEQALMDVQAALRADARVRDASDIGGGRAAAPTLTGLADALASDVAPSRQVVDRFQRVHAQPNVTNPIGNIPAARAPTRPAPASPDDIAANARPEQPVLSAARELSQADRERDAGPPTDAQAAALRRLSSLPDEARRRGRDGLVDAVQQHPEATRPAFAANLLGSLDRDDAAALYERLAPRDERGQPRPDATGRLTDAQHLAMARALTHPASGDGVVGGTHEHIDALPDNALRGMYGALRDRVANAATDTPAAELDGDLDAAATIRAQLVRRGGTDAPDLGDPGQRTALAADARFAFANAANPTDPDGRIAARLSPEARAALQSQVLQRLDAVRPPEGADEPTRRAFKQQIDEVLNGVTPDGLPRETAEQLARIRLRAGLLGGVAADAPAEPPPALQGLPGTIIAAPPGLPVAQPPAGVPTAADLTRLRAGGDQAAYQREVTRVADALRASVAEDRARVGAPNSTLDGMSPEVLGDLDRYLAGTLAQTPDNAGAAATARAALMRARAGESYDLSTDAGRERLAQDAAFAFGPDRSRNLLLQERNPEDPAHTALPPEVRAQLQSDLLAKLEPQVGRTANAAVAAALGNVTPPEGELAGRFTRLKTLADGGDVTDAAIAAARRGYPRAGNATTPNPDLAAELDKLDQLGGPAGEDRRHAIDRLAAMIRQGPLSRRHAFTRDALATLNPTDAARLWEGIRPAGEGQAVAPGESRYDEGQLAALGMSIGLGTATPGAENPALRSLPPEALRAIDAAMARGFENSTDRHTMAAAATVRAAALRAQQAESQPLDLQDPDQAAAIAERVRLLSTPRADGSYDDRVAAAMNDDERARLRNAEIERIRATEVPSLGGRRQLEAYQAALRAALAPLGDQLPRLDPAVRADLEGRLSAAPVAIDEVARASLQGLRPESATALGQRIEQWRAAGPNGAADADELVGALTRELTPRAGESADAATERQRRLALLTAGDTPTARAIRAGVDRGLIDVATVYSQSHVPTDERGDTRPNLPDHQHAELTAALLRADLSGATPETRFAALHLRMEQLQRAKPDDLAANVAFAFNLPHTGPDGRPQPTMRDLMQGAGETISSPEVAARVEAEAQRTVAAALRARNDAEGRRILEATRAALPAGSQLRTILDGTPTVRPRARPRERPAVPAELEGAPTAQPREAVRVPPGSIEGVDFAALRAQLRRLNNTRVETELPLEGPYHMVYRPHSHGEGTANPFRYGTARTVAMIQMVAELYYRQTGMKLRVGDLSKYGGGDIPGHSSHERGINIDLDLAFSDGRTTAHPQRGSDEATYRSPNYDRESTRIILRLFRSLNPNADILFNDPHINVRGVRAFGAHDNHIHIQGLGG